LCATRSNSWALWSPPESTGELVYSLELLELQLVPGGAKVLPVLPVLRSALEHSGRFRILLMWDMAKSSCISNSFIFSKYTTLYTDIYCSMAQNLKPP
jgi:hypothetical protein